MATKKRKPARLVITFENRDLRDDFRGWLSDGGGEQHYMESFEMRSKVPGCYADFDYKGENVIVKVREG